MASREERWQRLPSYKIQAECQHRMCTHTVSLKKLCFSMHTHTHTHTHISVVFKNLSQEAMLLNTHTRTHTYTHTHFFASLYFSHFLFALF